MTGRAIRWTICSALLGSIISVAAAQEPEAKKANVSTSNPPTGAELYARHCAACHGSDLKGSGPFPAPYRKPPDLTTLTRRHGGKFPDAYIVKVLRNGVTLPAHGPAEMPVWGPEFEGSDRLDRAQVEVRIKNLAEYIRSLQAK